VDPPAVEGDAFGDQKKQVAGEGKGGGLGDDDYFGWMGWLLI